MMHSNLVTGTGSAGETNSPLWQRVKKLWTIDIGRMPANTTPPDKLLPFVWHFARQVKPLLILLLVLEGLLALALAALPWFFGRIIDTLSTHTPATAWPQLLPILVQFGVLLFVALPLVLISVRWLYEHAYMPYFGNMIRKQLHWYTLRHSWSYFQDDYAGRIANKVMESAPSIRDALRSMIGAVWYALVFSVTAMWMMLGQGGWLALPVAVYLALYVAALWYFVPQIKQRAAHHSENHSTLVGKVVDGLTNVFIVKLFARKQHEDKYIEDFLRVHSGSMKAVGHKIWHMNMVVDFLNKLLLMAVAVLGVYLWFQGQSTTGALAMALPLAWQIGNMSGWIMHEVTMIFESIGRVQEGMETLIKPHKLRDKPNAAPLKVTKGDIRFDNVAFHYGSRDNGKQGKHVINALNLHIRPGEKVGLVGSSGAGKSTLLNLLLRVYDVEAGAITIDGQNIADVTQDSLRAQIATVTQNTDLLHRSVFDNIRYGRPDATDEMVFEAAKRAEAHGFITELPADWKGRSGYNAHVGERGVKLSGGQRQRVSIARAILKDAPILLLDEATSALDSESEHAIQQSLTELMEGRTVLAIAHRLSTLQVMDRIIVLDKGKVMEDGTHAQLMANGGHYARLWKMQTAQATAMLAA